MLKARSGMDGARASSRSHCRISMFGVVVCPRCRRAKGVKLSQKMTTCSCGFAIRVVRARISVRAPNARELVEQVGRVNARLAGGLAAYERPSDRRPRRRLRDVHARAIAASTRAGDRPHRIQAAALALTKELEMFSLEDWRKVVEGLGISDPEDALEGLLRTRVVYEPKPGFYRSVILSP